MGELCSEVKMRTLINYLRSCFCKHDWEEVKHAVMYSPNPLDRDIPIGDKWVYRCKKCGSFKTYQDF